MGLVAAKLMRPIRRFNIDNRARTVISKDKPTPAPRHTADLKQLKLARELNPNFLENHYKKDLNLDEHLKNVYVTSTDSKVIVSYRPESDRPLPQSRERADFEFGFYMPDTTSEGKCTLKQIFEIIIQHKEDSVNHNIDFLATKYKLDKSTIKKLLDYYKLYQLLEPPKSEDEDEVLEKQIKFIKTLGIHPWEKKRPKEE